MNVGPRPPPPYLSVVTYNANRSAENVKTFLETNILGTAGYGQFIFLFFRMSRHTRHTHFFFLFTFLFPFPFPHPFIVPLRSTHDITTLMTHLRHPDDDSYDYAFPTDSRTPGTRHP